MTKTLTRKKHARNSNHLDLRTIENIIKKAARTTRAADLKDRISEIVSNSIHKARQKSKSMTHGVSHFVHKKPYVSLGVTTLALGAGILLLIKKIRDRE